MTVSPALNSAVGCSSPAMRASAARGSPWLPVASAKIRSRGRRSNASMPRNGGRPSSIPHSRATATTRSIARPRMQTCRPAARPASAAERSRATLEAKVVTTTLPFALAMSQASVLATSRSDGLSPSRRTLVESQTSASTPSSPSALKRASSVGGPMIGVGSIFQSAVWTTSPAGVRIASAALSGIEWATAMNSTTNGPITTLSPGSTTFNGILGAPGSPSRRASAKSGREARHIDGRAQVRPKLGKGADVILMRMGDDDPDQILLRLLDEAEIRHDEIDARQVLAGEGDAEVDHQPLARVRRPIAVKGAIHADLAQAAERGEHELAVVCHLSSAFRRVRSRRRPPRAGVRARQSQRSAASMRLEPALGAHEQAAGRINPLENALALSAAVLRSRSVRPGRGRNRAKRRECGRTPLRRAMSSSASSNRWTRRSNNSPGTDRLSALPASDMRSRSRGPPAPARN